MKFVKSGFAMVATFGLFMLAGCELSATSSDSDNGASSVNANMKKSVDSASELPVCNARYEGEAFFIKSEQITKMCSDGYWYELVNDNAGQYNGAVSSSSIVSVDPSSVVVNDIVVNDIENALPCDAIYKSGDTRMASDDYYSYTYTCVNGNWMLTNQIALASNSVPVTTPVAYSSASVSVPVTVRSSASTSTVVRSSASTSSAVVSSTTSSVFRATPSCVSGAMFCGSYGYRVETGFDDGSDESGYWYVYSDAPDGGNSTALFPVARGNEYSDDAFDPVIDYCGGLCATISLSKGSLDYDPYVGFGFNISGPDQTPADVTAWGGLCVTYASETSIKMEMGLGSMESYYGYDVPAVYLPKSASTVQKCYTWSSFKQDGWGKAKISGSEAAMSLANLKFKVQGSSGTKVAINIMSIGTY